MKEKVLFALSIIWGIALSVILTILLAIPLFKVEIPIYKLTEWAQMGTEKLWHNFLVLMNYLLNPFVAKLNMPDFASSADGLKHFAQVKNLFMLTVVLLVVLLPFFIKFIKDHLRITFHIGLRVVMIFPLAIGAITALIGFDQFFVYFHKVLFRDDTWLFDPMQDPIINVLPEQYFMHTFIIFLLIYEIFFFILYKKGYFRTNKIK